jgi:hypothetical protein
MDASQEATLRLLFRRYGELTAYCDRFVDQVSRALAEQIHCGPGCCTCCQLSSVNALEAAVLWAARPGIVPRHPQPQPAGGCPLLRDGLCSLYPARPLICRTHGVAMKMVIGTEVTVHHCPRNFQRLSPGQLASSPLLLDEALITTNLSRLNIAFCRIIGSPQLSAQRFDLVGIQAGRLPPAVTHAASCAEQPKKD